MTLEEEPTTYEYGKVSLTVRHSYVYIVYYPPFERLETFWAHVAQWFRAQAQKSDWLGFQCQLYHQLADFREVTQPFYVLAFYIYKAENVVYSNI